MAGGVKPRCDGCGAGSSWCWVVAPDGRLLCGDCRMAEWEEESDGSRSTGGAG